MIRQWLIVFAAPQDSFLSDKLIILHGKISVKNVACRNMGYAFVNFNVFFMENKELFYIFAFLNPLLSLGYSAGAVSKKRPSKTAASEN